MHTINIAIIAAAGRGERMGNNIPKQYLDLMGRPVLWHSINAFDKCSKIDTIIIALSPDGFDLYEKYIGFYNFKKEIHLVKGGSDRQESVYNCLKTIDSSDNVVLIHDGVRPLINESIILRSIEAALEFGACAAGMPLKDTIKLVDDDKMALNTPDRSMYYSVQTPQSFKYDVIFKAHKDASEKSFTATDDAALVERMSGKVKMVEGGYFNIKITTIEDLKIAAVLMEEFIL